MKLICPELPEKLELVVNFTPSYLSRLTIFRKSGLIPLVTDIVSIGAFELIPDSLSLAKNCL
ncbi:hypothetical protein FACS1894125_3860 [Actinomycetota bacterium]|nr:hypothetical protein FACS1894125_3860 [Actinomycetota bacterium]